MSKQEKIVARKKNSLIEDEEETKRNQIQKETRPPLSDTFFLLYRVAGQ